MSGWNDNKRKGTAWEFAFYARALKEGLDVFLPCGDHLPQDCIVVNGAGKVFKVQIKGTSSRAVSSHPNSKIERYKVIAAGGSNSKTPIDCTKVDVVACYILPLDLWYLIPCLALNNAVSAWFTPNYEKTKSKFEPFKEGWDYFKC
jgi:hypothetical protein